MSRYYYAIVECDRVETASFLYSELEGTELERSANVFDLSFVPDDMTFQDKFRYARSFLFSAGFDYSLEMKPRTMSMYRTNLWSLSLM